MEKYGHEQIVNDLQKLSKDQKEFLVVAAWETITSIGRPSATGIHLAERFLKKIGISGEELMHIITENKTLIKHSLANRPSDKLIQTV